MIRPVGHTGLLIQMLDGDRTPMVLDVEQLFGSPLWTGFALIPRRTNPPMLAAGGVSLVSIVAFGIVSWYARGRASHSVSTNNVGTAAVC